ncbi:hydrogenase maturation protease [Zoogloea sp. LCSB751]|uniref:hydrogenase maturation protease n=1 Tax=Zoogloea sp. LCSB751 TaxID=1965277 RepID=UPI0020B10FB2|nr:hydrogenase maturation protease [Zoogloea sp. LCSB751]
MSAWWIGPSAGAEAMALVVFAIGNPSRGDDALGPRLMAELESWNLPDVRLVSDFQLQIEHALDLDDRDLALFIDAGTGTPAPYSFREIHPAPDRSISSHALSPEAVLHVYEEIRRPPPPAFVLCVRGEDFQLGAELSGIAAAHLTAARNHLLDCLATIDVAYWRQRTGLVQVSGKQG